MSADNQIRAKRPAQAAEYLGMGVSTFWRYTKTVPDFPRPVKLSSRVTIFLADELDAWVAKRAASRQMA